MDTFTPAQEEIINILSEPAKKLFSDIVFSRKLGANRHINMIGQMMLSLIEKDSNVDLMLDELIQLTNFFKETRGNQSRAVFNGIDQMSVDFDSLRSLELNEVKKTVQNALELFSKDSERAVDNIMEYATNLSNDWNAVMLFDYSSTLNEFILKSKKDLKIYVPESRALDGGKPFLEACETNGNPTMFIPDTTLFEALKDCDAAFIGSESFYADGTVFNTIGSDLLAVACEKLNKPLYVLTPLLKLDERNTYGIKKLSPMPYDYFKRLGENWDSKPSDNISYEGIKLVSLEPEQIKAYITEDGIIPPHSMFDTSRRYLEKIRGK